MNRNRLLLPLLGLIFSASAGAEVLQSISDDSVNVVIEPQLDEKERHFNYRVICAPGDEVLDDCQSESPPSADGVDGKPTMVVPMPDFPPEAPDPEQQSPKLEKKPAVSPSKSALARKTKVKTKRPDNKKAAAKSKPSDKRGKKAKK